MTAKAYSPATFFTKRYLATNKYQVIGANPEFSSAQRPRSRILPQGAKHLVFMGTLTEIAPGMALQREVLAVCGAPVAVPGELRLMDARLFDPRPLHA